MYYIYFDNIRLPVAPEKLTMKIKNKNTTFELSNGGEINIPRSPGLTEISFDALLPALRYSFARYGADGFKAPSYYLDLFEELKVNKKPFAFKVIRSVNAETVLRYSAELADLSEEAQVYADANGDGVINAADARIFIRDTLNGSVMLDPTVLDCLIEDYTITEDAKKHGRDYVVSMKLRQYAEYGLKRVNYTIETQSEG